MNMQTRDVVQTKSGRVKGTWIYSAFLGDSSDPVTHYGYRSDKNGRIYEVPVRGHIIKTIQEGV